MVTALLAGRHGIKRLTLSAATYGYWFLFTDVSPNGPLAAIIGQSLAFSSLACDWFDDLGLLSATDPGNHVS